MRRPFFPFALLLTLLAIDAPLVDALAQPAPSSAASASLAPAQDEADRLFREGNELYKQKRFADAEVLFEKAFAKKPAHDIAANLGYVELYQNKLVEAAEHLAYAVRIWPPTGKDDKRQGAVERLAKVKAEIATLTIEVNVAGARVLLGEREVGTSPLTGEAFADAGHVVVRAQRDGYRDAERAIDVAKGSAQRVTLAMEAVPASMPTTTTATATATAAPTSPPRSKVPAYVIGGAGVLSVIVGGVLIGVAEEKRADVRSTAPLDSKGQPLCGQGPPAGGAAGSLCDGLRATAGSASTFGNAGIALLALGGVALAGAAAYWFWPSKPARAASPISSMAPMIAVDGGGLQWTGSF